MNQAWTGECTVTLPHQLSHPGMTQCSFNSTSHRPNLCTYAFCTYCIDCIVHHPVHMHAHILPPTPHPHPIHSHLHPHPTHHTACCSLSRSSLVARRLRISFAVRQRAPSQQRANSPFCIHRQTHGHREVQADTDMHHCRHIIYICPVDTVHWTKLKCTPE